jgi:Ca2+-binding EF-hand superfamily protein
MTCSTLLPLTPFAVAAADNDPDQYEERMVARSAERAARASKADRLLWVKALSDAYPNRVGNPTKEDEYGDWFDLVVGKGGGDWRRDTTTNTPFAELFEKVVQRLELGPVPSIRREEFLKYARRTLVPAQSGSSEMNEDIDKVFRVLDRNGDGVLSTEEMTARLREDRLRADVDGNGRIDKDEYRAHFGMRVNAAAEVILAKINEQNKGTDGKNATARTKAALPGWFAELDTDKDGQLALFEWRKAGRALNLFMEMDLDNDGLLTRDEYLRYTLLKEKAEQAERLMAVPVPEKRVMK